MHMQTLLKEELEIKLDANEADESLWDNSELWQIGELLKGMNRYPDPYNIKFKHKLINRIFRKEGLVFTVDQMIIGNGSDELIKLVMESFFSDKKTSFAAEPAFSEYERLTRIVGGNIEKLVFDNLLIDVTAFISEVKSVKPDVVFFTNPQNPTGQIFSLEEIESIVSAVEGIVVIDEAYIEFSNESALSLVAKYENLVVIRTLSKAFGLAGLRLGYAISNKKNIDKMNDNKLAYNISCLSETVGYYALDYEKRIENYIEQVVKVRNLAVKQLSEIKDLEVYESSANFVLFTFEEWETYQTFKCNVEKSPIRLRFFDEGPEKLKRSVRITITNLDAYEAFYRTLKESCNYEN